MKISSFRPHNFGAIEILFYLETIRLLFMIRFGVYHTCHTKNTRRTKQKSNNLCATRRKNAQTLFVLAQQVTWTVRNRKQHEWPRSAKTKRHVQIRLHVVCWPPSEFCHNELKCVAKYGIDMKCVCVCESWDLIELWGFPTTKKTLLWDVLIMIPLRLDQGTFCSWQKRSQGYK